MLILLTHSVSLHLVTIIPPLHFIHVALLGWMFCSCRSFMLLFALVFAFHLKEVTNKGKRRF